VNRNRKTRALLAGVACLGSPWALAGCGAAQAAPSVHDCSRLIIAYMESHGGNAADMPEPAVCKALTADQMHMVSVVIASYVAGK